MRNLSSLAVCLALLPALALAAPAQSVEVTGEAAIFQGDQAQARDRALEDALRKAVEQACGTLVSAESRTEQSVLISDKILTRAKGYVSSYEVLGTKAADGTVQISIRAKVGTDKLSEDLQAIGVTLQRKGMPRIVALIAEQRFDEVKPSAWWGQQNGKTGQGVLGLDQRLAENALMAEWTRAGFPFVTLDELSSKVHAAGITSVVLTKDDVLSLGRVTEADVVIRGTAISTKSQDGSKLLEGVSQGADSVTGVSCSCTVSLEAHNADNDEVLAAAEATQPAFNQSLLACGHDALVKALHQASASLQKDVLAHWQAQLTGAGSTVRLKVAGFDSLHGLNAFKAVLGAEVRGVKSVDQKRFENGAVDLDVRIDGSADAFAEELEAKKFGKHKLSVKSMTANVIDALLR